MYRNRSSAKVKIQLLDNISLEEIYATIAIIFARRLLAKELSISQLWSKTWGQKRGVKNFFGMQCHEIESQKS